MAAAENEFAEASKDDPGFAEAWYQLGRMRLARRDVDGGRAALQQALAADPWYVSPYRPLLLLEIGQQEWSQVEVLSRRLLEINPYLTDVHYYRGLACVGRGDIDAARAELEAIVGGPEGESFALRHHLQGLVLERQNRKREAREAYLRYLELDPGGAAADEVRERLAALDGR